MTSEPTVAPYLTVADADSAIGSYEAVLGAGHRWMLAPALPPNTGPEAA